MIVNNLSGLGIVDMQVPWGWRTEAAKVWWKKILPRPPVNRIHDMGRDHAGAPVDTARGKSSHCVEVRKFTSQARKRLAGVEDNISPLVSAETVWP